jgi:hypothetical protein
MDEWKAIEPGVWKPQKEGDQIVGVLVNKEAKDEARRLSARYLLENETGKLLVWGSAVIDDRMRHVNIGDKIRITYQGKTKNKRSQDVLLYRIEVSRDPVGGFSRPLPPPPACLMLGWLLLRGRAVPGRPGIQTQRPGEALPRQGAHHAPA